MAPFHSASRDKNPRLSSSTGALPTVRRKGRARGRHAFGGGHSQLPQVCSLGSELDFHLWIARLNVLNLTATAWGQHIGDATDRLPCSNLGDGQREQIPTGQGTSAPEPAGPGAPFWVGLSRRHPGLAASLAGGLHTLKCHLFLCRSISSFLLVLYEFYCRS